VNNIRQKQPASKFHVLLCGIGLTCLIANSIVLYVTFLWAYLLNNYSFSANINSIGEAHIEFVLLPITLILGIYASIYLFEYMPKQLES